MVISRQPSCLKKVHKIFEGELTIAQVGLGFYTVKDTECHECGGSELLEHSPYKIKE